MHKKRKRERKKDRQTERVYVGEKSDQKYQFSETPPTNFLVLKFCLANGFTEAFFIPPSCPQLEPFWAFPPH